MTGWFPVAAAGAPLPVADLLAWTGLAASKAEARRLVSQGGAYLNNERIGAGRVLAPADLLDGRYVILRRGKRDVAAVEVLAPGEVPEAAHAACVLMPLPGEAA